MDSFSNTLHRFKNETSPAPCGGRVITFKWPGVPPPKKILATTEYNLKHAKESFIHEIKNARFVEKRWQVSEEDNQCTESSDSRRVDLSHVPIW